MSSYSKAVSIEVFAQTNGIGKIDLIYNTLTGKTFGIADNGIKFSVSNKVTAVSNECFVSYFTPVDDEEPSWIIHANFYELKLEELEKLINEKDNATDTKPYILFFDTETTGLPKNWKAPVKDLNNWPRLVQLAYLVYDLSGNLIHSSNEIIKPNGFTIPTEASNVHHITTEIANKRGCKIEDTFEIFLIHLKRAKVIVAHNMAYDEKIIGAELIRLGLENVLETKKKICTMESTVELCKIKGQYSYKWPKLQELHRYLFNFDFDGAHDALADIHATAKCFWKLVDMKIFNIGSKNENDYLESKVKKLLFLPAFSLYPTAFKFHRFKDLIFISIKRLVEEIEFTPKLFPGDDSDRISVSRPKEIYFKVVDTELEKKLNLAINSLHPMTFFYLPSKEANTNILLDFYLTGEND
jgi:DNA polymerase-3 subunit epsilon